MVSFGYVSKGIPICNKYEIRSRRPNHSAHNLLNRLGMNNLNEGFISASFDDEY